MSMLGLKKRQSATQIDGPLDSKTDDPFLQAGYQQESTARDERINYNQANYEKNSNRGNTVTEEEDLTHHLKGNFRRKSWEESSMNSTERNDGKEDNTNALEGLIPSANTNDRIEDSDDQPKESVVRLQNIMGEIDHGSHRGMQGSSQGSPNESDKILNLRDVHNKKNSGKWGQKLYSSKKEKPHEVDLVHPRRLQTDEEVISNKFEEESKNKIDNEQSLFSDKENQYDDDSGEEEEEDEEEGSSGLSDHSVHSIKSDHEVHLSAKKSLKIPRKEDGDSPIKSMLSGASPMRNHDQVFSSTEANEIIRLPSNHETHASAKLNRAQTHNFIQEEVNPNEVELEIKRQDSKKSIKRSAKKVVNHISPETSMEGKYNKHRLTPNFFNKHLQHRTGIPTLTAKNRETPNLFNLNFNQGLTLHSEASETKSNTDKARAMMNAQLHNQMASIAKQKFLRQKMEQFILQFNKRAEAGIQYLISSNLIEDTPEKIAYILLITEGLNKEMIGQCLGSHHEKNRQILKAYCEILDFRGLKFDQAMRVFLSRFKLPGEAQQIERIVEGFAAVYHADNPDEFTDEQTAFILAYSLLMLNTDLHSDMIPLNKKMKKATFVENNMKILKTLTKEKLEKLYDSVAKEKFETKIDYIETIYNRIYIENIEAHGESLKDILNLAKDLMKGDIFLKYGRRGKPHQRKVWISEKEDYIYWADPLKKYQKPRCIPFSDILDVLSGHNATKVLIKNKVPSEFDSKIVSIVAVKRTLDLKAPTVEIRAKWERYFRLTLVKKKEQLIEKKNNKRAQEKEKLSEIWKIDILPNWEFHWDYQRNKPRGFDQIKNGRLSNKTKKTQTNEHKGIAGFFSFLWKKSKASPNKNKHLVLDEVDETENELRQIARTKSLLLVTLWKRGIPDWLRKTLWPICIGNQLEITENLYAVLQTQAKNFSSMNSEIPEVYAALRRMENDMKETFPAFKASNVQVSEEAVTKILKAFIFYRPDVGYVKGMSHLVQVLLMYCSEYQAFSCFINLTHSYHFLTFFRGDMRHIEWRIRFFDEMFEKEIPNLFKHFKALDVTTEMFLLDWFLSLFSVIIRDADIVSRIWDCFFLEGDVFAIKTALAILKYFELELKMLTFDGVTNFLWKLPKDMDEEMLFDLIEKINIPWSHYQKVLEHQKVADVNTQIHQALLI